MGSIYSSSSTSAGSSTTSTPARKSALSVSTVNSGSGTAVRRRSSHRGKSNSGNDLPSLETAPNGGDEHGGGGQRRRPSLRRESSGSTTGESEPSILHVVPQLARSPSATMIPSVSSGGNGVGGAFSTSRDEGDDVNNYSRSTGVNNDESAEQSRVRTTSEVSMSGGASGGGGNRALRATKGFMGGNPAVLDEHLSGQLFAFLPEARILFTCGHWDHSLRATSVETGCLVQSVCQQKDVITCLALAHDFGHYWLVSGSRDCTLMVWDVHVDRELPLNPHPRHILYGHDDSVTCVAISPEMDIVVSGSDDGTVVVHNLRDGAYVRSIYDGVQLSPSIQQNPSVPASASAAAAAIKEPIKVPMVEQQHQSGGAEPFHKAPTLKRAASDESTKSVAASTVTATSAITAATTSSSTQQRQQLSSVQQQLTHGRITWVGISKEAYIVTYAADDQLLTTFSINGDLIATRTVPEALHAFLISEDGKVLISGGSSCLVAFRWVRLQY